MHCDSQETLKPSTRQAFADLDTYWAMVDAARHECGMDTVIERPEGSITPEEYAAHYGVSKETAFGQLRRLEAKGAFRRVSVLMPNTRGQMISRPVFVPCQQ